MTRKTQEAVEKTQDDLQTKTQEFMSQITVATQPVVVTGVQRKINIGNYETIDIYCAVSMPQEAVDTQDKEAFAKIVKEAAEVGFYITSQEVSSRYDLIKESKKAS